MPEPVDRVGAIAARRGKAIAPSRGTAYGLSWTDFFRQRLGPPVQPQVMPVTKDDDDEEEERERARAGSAGAADKDRH